MTIESISSVAAYQGSVPMTAVRPAAEPLVVEAPEPAAKPIERVSASEEAAEANGSNGSFDQQATELVNQNAQIRKAVEEINKKNSQTEAVFGIHDGTNRVTIKIVDKESKEVVKEFPPEKTLDMIEKVWEMAGILVDEKR